MTDNTTINAMSGGDVIASDDISGVKFQRIKLIHGVDGTNDGDVSSANRLPVDPLGIPGTARQLSAGATSTNVALTSGTKRISMVAVGADIRFAVGSSSQTATSTSHLILYGERLEFAMPATANIAAIRNAGVSGTLEITELS